MHVTVAICTWNRATLLDPTLARMRELAVPAGVTWELLVVNNNCTDATDEVIAKYAGALPLRRLHEAEQGLSHAELRLEAARGELLIWTDDDVLVDPGWLAAYAVAAAEHPAVGYFGGPVEPWFASPPPRWVAENLDLLRGPFALRELGPETRPFVGDESPFGANMAFRVALVRGHRFDPRLGRVGAAMLSGEETALIDRVRAETGPGLWVGPARVRHYIPPERMTAAYVWKFYHGLGRTRQRVTPFDRGTPLVRGVPRWVLRKYAVARVKSLLFAPTRGRRWVENLVAAATLRGIADECRAARRAVPAAEGAGS